MSCILLSTKPDHEIQALFSLCFQLAFLTQPPAHEFLINEHAQWDFLKITITNNAPLLIHSQNNVHLPNAGLTCFNICGGFSSEGVETWILYLTGTSEHPGTAHSGRNIR